jgi:hypothetical protein
MPLVFAATRRNRFDSARNWQHRYICIVSKPSTAGCCFDGSSMSDTHDELYGTIPAVTLAAGQRAIGASILSS